MIIQTDASETSSRTTALSKESTEIGRGAGNLSLDVMGEFLEKFYNPETDIIICPIDLRSHKIMLTELADTQVSAS